MDWDGHIQGGLVGNNFNLALQGNLFVSAETGVQFEKLYASEFGNPSTGQPGILLWLADAFGLPALLQR